MRCGTATNRIAILAQAIIDLNADRFAQTASCCLALLEDNPDDIEAQLLRGLAVGACGHVEDAALLLHGAARGRGDAGHPCLDLVAILRRIGKPAWIEPQIRAALCLAPHDAGLLYAFGDYLYDAGRVDEAIASLTAAVRLRPGYMAARNSLALAFAALGDNQAAIDELLQAVKTDPSVAGTWANLGLLLKDDGRFDEALNAYDAALALAPHDAQIRVNRVVALLRAGRWREAWPDYEWRLTLAGHATRQPRLLPELSLLPDLKGRTILALHEDGFGDTLHFARYLPLLAARGARIVVSVPEPLVRIMRTLPGDAEVHGPTGTLPPYDFYCPFFSLPRAFETTPDTIPATIPYLYADPASAEVWGSRLPHAVARVGLAWAGQARPTLPGFRILDGRRSMALTTLAPLADAVPGVVFVSLQFGQEAAQAGNPPSGMTLFDPMPLVEDFADTAAIIANLDLVISVDTSVVHLAGAMGKPVFLLDRYDHCWRWLSGRDDSPWYSAMRIFRQDSIGGWVSALRHATAALVDFVGVLRDRPGRNSIGVDLLEIPKAVERDS
jgi:tetratricopeptide (TPR) repeat protein